MDGALLLVIIFLIALFLAVLLIGRGPEQRRPERPPERREEPRKDLGPYIVGKQFEDYVYSMFPPDRFECTHRTVGAAELNGGCRPDCYLPDLRFKDRATGREFWVECKYRSYRVDGSIVWADQKLLNRYIGIRMESRLKVYVMIGLGGDPSRPRELFLVDLDDTHYTELYRSKQARSEVQVRRFGSLADLEMLCARRRSQGERHARSRYQQEHAGHRGPEGVPLSQEAGERRHHPGERGRYEHQHARVEDGVPSARLGHAEARDHESQPEDYARPEGERGRLVQVHITPTACRRTSVDMKNTTTEKYLRRCLACILRDRYEPARAPRNAPIATPAAYSRRTCPPRK